MTIAPRPRLIAARPGRPSPAFVPGVVSGFVPGFVPASVPGFVPGFARLLPLSVGVLLVIAGCSSSTPARVVTGSGGGSGTGGSSASGNGTGGGTASGSGGGPSSGGSSPGSPGSGGQAASGAPGSGGGPGPATDGGGTVPTDGGAGPGSLAYTFDSSLQGWGFNPYVPPPPGRNLAAAEAGALPTLAFDATTGNPTPGAMKLSATFTDYRQSVDVVLNPQPVLNLAGRTIHAKVRLSSGTLPSGVGATLHVGTGATFAYGAGAYTTLVPGSWTDLTVDLTKVTTAMFDPTAVAQIGIQIYSGDPQPDAGTFPGPVDFVIHIDSVTDTPAGTVVAAPVAYDFDIATEGFDLNRYVSTTQSNLAAPGSGTTPTVTFDSTDGNPSPGSLKVSATFSGFKQFIDVTANPSPSLNLAGKVLHAKVRLTSGTFEAGAGATLHASTGTGFVYGAGPYTPLSFGVWTDLVLDLSTVTTPGFDATQVVQLGVQFYSGDPPEAGAFAGPNSVVFHIDSITE